jgi:hypothetical protein
MELVHPRTKNTARFRRVTRNDIAKHGRLCHECKALDLSTAKIARKIFESSSGSRYGFQRVMLCNEHAQPSLLFSGYNKLFAA